MMKKSGGFSIVELLVSILISSLILIGVGHIYFGNKSTYRMQDGLARVQENIRYAKHILAEDIRMAGLQGCNSQGLSLPINIILNPAANMTFENTDIVNGYNGAGGAWNPAIPAWLTGNLAGGTAIKANTDVLVIRKLEAGTVNLSTNMFSNVAAITVANKITFQPNDVIFISDCEDATIFQATAGTTATTINHTTASNTNNKVAKAYQTDALVGRLQTYSYYVKDTNRNTETGLPIYALFRQDINGNESEVVEGVEDFKITYGIDTNADNTADTYQTANAVANWENVVSIKVLLLMTSVEETSPKAQPYTFNGIVINNPGDRLLRQSLEQFISLRNRGL